MGQLRELFEQFTKATGFTIGFLDHPGLNILIASGWRDICVKFHRACPVSLSNCETSNRHLLDQLDEPGKVVIEACDNGLFDCATPIIIKGKHIASLATGQLFLKAPDLERFRGQARRFGFNEAEYLHAVQEIAVVPEDQLKAATSFLGQMAVAISGMGYAKLIAQETSERLEKEIGERMRAGEALRKEQLLMLTLMDNLSAYVYFKDADSRFIRINPAMARLFGLSDPKQGIGKTDADFFTEEHARKAVADEQAIMRTGQPLLDIDEKVTWPDGRTSWGLSSTLPLRDDKANIIGTCGISIDITDRKRAEEALRESEFFFKESQRAAFIGSYRADFVTGYWVSSEVMDQIFGIDLNYHRTVAGWLDLVHPDDREEMGRYLREDVIAKRQPFNREYRIIRKANGETRWVNGRGTTAFDSEGNCLSLVGTIQDITEHKQAEVREKELQAKLERATRMESLGMLAGGVAHDLNNMLNPLMGLPDMLSEYIERHGDPSDPDHGDALAALQAMKMSAQRAAMTVSDLVMMGRRGQFQKTPVDVNRVVDQMLISKQIQAMQAKQPDVQVSMQLSAESRRCLGSEARLGRVLMNLVGNAIEAIDGQGNVIVRTGRQVFADPHDGYEVVPPGDYVTIEVTDTGCGMDTTTLARIFEPFFSTKAPSERSGSGLGLSVVHGLVKDHSGFLDVKSEPGKGTTFTVYLPTVEGVAAAVVERSASGTLERILVVDDEPAILLLVRIQLKRLGYNSTAVSSGEEAMALFEAAAREGKPAPFELVLVDMLMKKMDGLATCRAIQGLYPNQKLIIISGHAPEGYEEQLRKSGTDWLAKPFSSAELACAVRARLDR